MKIPTVIAMTVITTFPAYLHRYYELPEPAHDLWASGRLHEVLGIPDDQRTRVEIIGGEIVVSPGLNTLTHARIASDIQSAVFLRGAPESDYPWRAVQNIDFNAEHAGDGYTSDLIALSAEVFSAAATQHARHLTAEQIGMAVEITSEATAADDREPDRQRTRPTKWNGYAHEGVEFYLLVDRAPDKRCVTLYSDPDLPEGVYDSAKTWEFGETVTLPEPFEVEIPTEGWLPWER